MSTLFLIFLALQLADAAITYLALGRGGREANPLARKLFDAMGVVPGILLLKVPFVIACYALDLTPPMYGVLITAYSLAVAWNIVQLRKLPVTKQAQKAT